MSRAEPCARLGSGRWGAEAVRGELGIGPGPGELRSGCLFVNSEMAARCQEQVLGAEEGEA